MKVTQMQGIGGLFSVTAIFSGSFLTNMLKIQKIHFFLMLIYIIIRDASHSPACCAGETLQVMNGQTKTNEKSRLLWLQKLLGSALKQTGKLKNYRKFQRKGGQGSRSAK